MQFWENVTKVIKVGEENVTVYSEKIRKNVKKLKKLKNGLTRAILGKRDKSDQSWTGKRDSKKKILLKLLLTRAKNHLKLQ